MRLEAEELENPKVRRWFTIGAVVGVAALLWGGMEAFGQQAGDFVWTTDTTVSTVSGSHARLDLHNAGTALWGISCQDGVSKDTVSFRSTDDGSTWTANTINAESVTQGGCSIWGDPDTVSSAEAWAITFDGSGTDATFFHTVNSGTTWDSRLVATSAGVGGGSQGLYERSGSLISVYSNLSSGESLDMVKIASGTLTNPVYSTVDGVGTTATITSHFIGVADNLYVCYDQASDLLFIKSANLGDTWAANVSVSLDNPVSCSIAENGGNLVIVIEEAVSGDIRSYRSTNSGSTWTEALIASGIGVGGHENKPNIVGFSPTNFAVTYRVDSTDEVFFALTNDTGATWTTAAVTANINSGSTLTQDIAVISSTEAGIIYSGQPGGASIRAAFALGLGPQLGPACIEAPSADVCVNVPADIGISAQEPRDVRVNYQVPRIVYVKERGSEDLGQEGLGLLYKFNESLALTLSADPCPNEGDARGYTGVESRALAVATDGWIGTTCATKRPGQLLPVLFRVVSDQNLAVAWASAGFNNAGFGNRMDLATLNCATTTGEEGFTSEHNTFILEDIGNRAIIKTGEIAPTLGDFKVDASDNARTIITGSFGAQIASCGGTLISQITSIGTWNAAALYGDFAYLGNGAGIRQYNVSTGTWVLVETTANATIPTPNGAPGMRISKDGDYLVVWNGPTVRVLNTTDFLHTVVSFTVSATGRTIQGCDMDLTNSYLYCVTPILIARFPVFDDLTSFGVIGTPGVPNPEPTATANPYDDTQTSFGSPDGGQPPGGGAPTLTPLPTTNFLGQTQNQIATSWGIPSTTVGILMGLLIAGIILFAFSQWTTSPIIIGMAAIIATIVNYFFGLWPLFVMLLIILLAIAIVSAAFFGRRGEGVEQ